jgi:hypothetical protein
LSTDFRPRLGYLPSVPARNIVSARFGYLPSVPARIIVSAKDVR